MRRPRPPAHRPRPQRRRWRLGLGIAMSQPWWQARDPDLGRERETKALGRRAWNWFTAYDGSVLSPADTEHASPPWADATITVKDRHDRTLGIPVRDISMWTPDTARLDYDSAPD